MVTTRRMLTLCGACMVDMLGYGIVLPLVPFFAKALNATPLEVTLIIAAFPAAQLLAAPVLGRLSDRLGRRVLIIGGLLASAASYILFAVSSSLVLLVASRAAAGAAGATFTVAQAYVADITTAKERTSGMAWLGSAYGLGLMLGPAVGGALVPFGLEVTGLVAAGLCLLNGLAAVILLPDPLPATSIAGGKWISMTLGQWARVYLALPLRTLVGIYVLAISTVEAIMAVLALYLIDVAHFTAQQAGGLWSWVGFLTVSVRVTVVGPLSKHLGESRLIQLGLMCDFIALTAFPFVSNLLLAYVATGLMSIGSSFIFPPLASLTSRSAEAEARGATLGGVQLFGGAGKVIGPVWAGFAFQSVGTLMPFLIGAAMMMCAFLLTARVGQSTSATGVAQAATQ